MIKFAVYPFNCYQIKCMVALLSHVILAQNNPINPNQTKRGYKVPEAFSNAYNFVYDEVWIINPSCKFLFWC